MDEGLVALEDAERTEPERIDLKLIVENVESVVKLGERDQHVLHHVVLLVQLAKLLGLSTLEERNVGWHEPAEGEAEERMVAKGDDVLDKQRRRTARRESVSIS